MWQKGPLPPNTWMWGGVVKRGESTLGFRFADFHGDHVTTVPGGERIEAADVAFYNNALSLPIRVDNEELKATRLGGA
jgi:hypothetical protein